MEYRTNPDDVKSEQSSVKSGRGIFQYQVKKLILPAAAFVIVILIVLIITNLVLISRVGNLKAELAELKEQQTNVQAGTSALPVQSAQRSIEDQVTGTVEPIADQSHQQVQPVEIDKEEADLSDQDTRISEPVEIAEDDRTAKTYPAESTEDPGTAIEDLPELKTKMQVTESYNQALAACMSGQYNQAIGAFRQVLQYPQPHQLKDNAQYWLAECYYAQKKYVQALAEFQKVKELFPKADKVFDAELKIAYTYHKLNRKEAAKHRLAQLSREWPESQYQIKIAALSEKIEAER
jgi:TolA-binding protein